MSERIGFVPLFLPLLLAAFWWNTEPAYAQASAALRGDYNFTLSRNCVITPAVGIQIDIAVSGIATYTPSVGAAGTVTLSNVKSTANSGSDANSATQTCSGTYDVSLDGSFTETLNCNLSFTQGPMAGQTATLNGIDLSGNIALDGTVLLLRNTVPNLETFTPVSPPGSPSDRICNGSGIATSRR